MTLPAASLILNAGACSPGATFRVAAGSSAPAGRTQATVRRAAASNRVMRNSLGRKSGLCSRGPSRGGCIQRLEHPFQRDLAIRFMNQAAHLIPVGLAIEPQRDPALVGRVGRGEKAVV